MSLNSNDKKRTVHETESLQQILAKMTPFPKVEKEKMTRKQKEQLREQLKSKTDIGFVGENNDLYTIPFAGLKRIGELEETFEVPEKITNMKNKYEKQLEKIQKQMDDAKGDDVKLVSLSEKADRIEKMIRDLDAQVDKMVDEFVNPKKVKKTKKGPVIPVIKEARKKAQIFGIKTCKKCLPKNFKEVGHGDLVCTKCGLVATGGQFVPGLEKDKEGNLVQLQAEKIPIDQLSPDAKFVRQVKDEAENLVRAFNFPFDITVDMVKDIVKFAEDNPVVKADKRELIVTIAARLFVEYKIFDGRLLSKARERIIRLVKSKINSRGEKVNKDFDEMVKEIEALPATLDAIEHVKNARINRRKNLEEKRQTGPVLVVSEKKKAKSMIFKILAKQPVEKLRQSALRLGLPVSDKDTKVKLIQKIAKFRIEQWEQNVSKTAGKFKEQKLKVMKFENCNERMQKIFNREGKDGIIKVAGKTRVASLEIPKVIGNIDTRTENEKEKGDGDYSGQDVFEDIELIRIKNIRNKSVNELIALICLAETSNNVTENDQVRNRALTRFHRLNDPESFTIPKPTFKEKRQEIVAEKIVEPKHVGKKREFMTREEKEREARRNKAIEKRKKIEAKRKGVSELDQTQAFLDKINKAQKDKLGKRRKTVMVAIDQDTGELKNMPNQVIGTVGAVAPDRIEFIKDPTREPVFQPTTTQGLKTKLKIRKKAKEAGEAKRKEKIDELRKIKLLDLAKIATKLGVEFDDETPKIQLIKKILKESPDIVTDKKRVKFIEKIERLVEDTEKREEERKEAKEKLDERLAGKKKVAKKAQKPKEPTLVQIRKHSLFASIEGRNRMKKDELLKAILSKGATKAELLALPKK